MAEFTRKAAERIVETVRFVEGQRVNPRPFTRRYPIGDDGGDTLRWFCLVTNLVQGGSATARDIDTGETFTVQHPHGQYYGVAGNSGGVADQNGDIIDMTCPGVISTACP